MLDGGIQSTRLLLATAYRWDSTVPLAVALGNAGFDVSIVAPKNHPLQDVPGLSGRWRYQPLRPRKSLRRAIEAAGPALVIPCDEPTMFLLRKLARDPRLELGLRSAIERTSISPEIFPLIASRAGLNELARRAGVLAADSFVISSFAELRTWLRREGAPAYLKVDRSTGGKGVIRVESNAAAFWAYLRLRLLFGLPRLLWHLVRYGDLSNLPLLIADPPAKITIQKAIEGIPANCAFAAWRGQMLACVAVEALATNGPTGVATTVRVRDDPLMIEAARRVASSLGLNGLYGLDFVLSRESAQPWLIEVNGRPTQTAYLRLGPGADLAGALHAAATNRPERPVGVFRASQIVRLFEDPSGGVRARDGRIAVSEEPPATVDLELETAAKSAMLSP